MQIQDVDLAWHIFVNVLLMNALMSLADEGSEVTSPVCFSLHEQKRSKWFIYVEYRRETVPCMNLC